MNAKRVKSRKRKIAAPYSKGELNRLIDAMCHPFFDVNKGFILVDGILHGLVEQNPPLSTRKFLKYNLPKLLQQMKEKTRKHK